MTSLDFRPDPESFDNHRTLETFDEHRTRRPASPGRRVSSGSWTAEQAPSDREYERRWWTLGVLCISLVMIVMANASLNVALPTLAEDLHTGVERRCSGSSTPTPWCSPACC